MDAYRQRDAFLEVEGDNYYERNKAVALEDGHLDPFLKYLKPGSRVLEIGCSDGKNLEYLRKKAHCECHGIDPSRIAIEVGRRSFPELALRVGSADQLAFEAESFDFIYFGFSLYVIDRELLPQVVAEADRVLKDNGHLGITDFDVAVAIKVPYRHRPGLFSYKTHYPRLFTAFHYSLLEKVPAAIDRYHGTWRDRVTHCVLRKELEAAYVLWDQVR